MTEPLFITERLLARQLTIDDVEAMLTVYGDPHTARFIGDGDALTREDAVRWVEVTDRNFEKRGYGMIALEDRSTNEVVGFIGIVHPGQQPEAEVKYAFRRYQWGKGLATEAIIALIKFGRQNWNVSEVIATVHPDNGPSMNVLRKAGFTHQQDRINEDQTITSIWANDAKSPSP